MNLMAYNEQLVMRVREALMNAGPVEEKKMFRGFCFMLHGKMCICVSGEEIMCRISPALFEEMADSPGVRPMVRNGKAMQGFVYVSEAVIRTRTALDYWIQAVLAFNPQAKISVSRRKKG